MGMESCTIFNEIDKLFIDYEVNDDQFNKDYGQYNNYCPVRNGSKRCDTDYEKLTAITGHAYVELTNNQKGDLDNGYDPSIELLVMELCHRLYKLSKDHSLSLNDAFENYLGKPMGGFNHLSILYNNTHFKDYSIGVMNGFYLLFKQMCETISIYEKPGVQQHEYISGVTQCYIMYDELYKFIRQCDPYLRLLNHLKTIYDAFKKAVIKYNDYDPSLISQLIEFSPINKTKFRSEFNSAGCKRLHEKLTNKTPNIIKIGIQLLEDAEKRKNGEESQITEDFDFGLDDEEDDDEDVDDVDGADDGADDSADDSADDGGEKKDGAIDNTSQDHEKNPVDLSDQPSMPNGDPSQPDSGTTSNTDDSNGKDKTLENSQSSDKLPGSSSDGQLPKETTQESKDTTEKTLQTLQSASSKLTELVSELDKAISQPNKETATPPAGGNGLKPGDSGGDPPSSGDPSLDPPPVSHNSQSSQTDPTKPSDPEHKQGDDQKEKGQQSALTIQGPSDGSINTPYVQVTKQDNFVNHINGIISKSVISMDILKKHKLTAVSVIGIAIAITLAIMYKYLSFGWRKEIKRKKTTKKVINSIGGKRPVQIIIKSSNRKKQTKKSTSSVYGKKSPLLSIYKLVQADPIPFINLFFVFIFFVYKRKLNYLEL
ncbi:CIR protein [Plasmodium chabaudi chabaudi]|uniref:CIR protein n=1 Tax=Plasmodium chabaudi chabaudi TaxID=31271 RepID=A0A4V0K6H4_PLACU|nr:CIR protein [Plasmodium chabaudi chabaudi]VTZ68579.1 CIR protein [Plasmodium chabaudi chabaudi]|eukprot:XP_016653885.1 CIR protein [Plasmodium chabaudi chabaudi]